MTTKERAEAHWDGYVGPMMETMLNVMAKGMMDMSRFHYISSHIHGAKHGIEDERIHAEKEKWAQEVERKMSTPFVAKAIASLCHSCHIPKCNKPLIERCEMEGVCAQYVPEAKQEAPTAAEQPLDFTLPSIALKCTAVEAWKKFESELKEWRAAEPNSAEELVERWDCLQALQTFYERGGNVAHYQSHVQIIMHDLAWWFSIGRDVMVAKAAMLVKNARRGYYSDVDNSLIMYTDGEQFTLKEGKP